MTTSQTEGNVSLSNTPQFDIESADDGGNDGKSTRCKPNVDFKDRNKQNTQPERKKEALTKNINH